MDAKAEAIANADAHLNNAGLRTYTEMSSCAAELLIALRELQANPNDPRAHRAALDAIALAMPVSNTIAPATGKG
ncbi:hypothetical protein [Burkholderia sp. Ac-20349]|uniref:hypothetical protein n=1 Tax=Burkholderia sp. Ac-20349 TaxID=2703893 RepID=UPI00197C89F4|nr:hypothetical protein [Burkholderia sp. Ac-20349]MBN3839338.1 hypothetical protein [Burkholderia sp. Ac-20349]